MKLEMSEATHSDYSCDSQSSQDSSTTDYVTPPTSRPSLSLASLEGLNSGVPTRTTATLTPTHLRNIEQTFVELQCRAEHERLAAPHAGFVPPSVAAHADHYGILNTMGFAELGGGGGGGSVAGGSLHVVSPGPTSSGGDSSSSSAPPAAKRRNTGGRRPAKPPHDISPEEEERRSVRRERNKMAAARCRKRRLDHTNELVEETEGLELKKKSLQDEIRQLNESCQQLQYVLDNHRLGCRLRAAPAPLDVKPFQHAAVDSACLPLPLPPDDAVYVKVEMPEDAVDGDIFTSPQANKRIMLSAANPRVVTTHALPTPLLDSLETPPAQTRPNRPCSLLVPVGMTPAQAHGLRAAGDLASVGIDISTPSSSLPFNFDSLMDGGTGLTPVQACATQQSRTHPEVLSPETAHNNKLVSL